MSLISILLFTIAIMSFSFGLLTLIGASRVDRLRSAWFCFATIGSAMWAISIAVFLSLAPDATSAEFWIYGIYVPPMLMLVGLLGYVHRPHCP